MNIRFTTALIATFLTLAAPLAQAQQTVTKQVKQALNVRSGPGVGYSDIGDLRGGQRVQVLGYDATGRWAMINWQGQVAYVSARYLKDPSRSVVNNTGLGMKRVTGIPANDPDGGLVVRNGPGTRYSRIFVLPQGTGINVVEISPDGKWSRAQFSDGGYGWVRNRYLANAGGGVSSSVPNTGSVLAQGMPAGLSCVGTEPFWAFHINPNGTTEYTEVNDQGNPIYGSITAVNNASYPYTFAAGAISGVLNNQTCSDGMSEVSYPWTLQLNAPINGYGQVLNGCCSAQ